MDLSSVRSASPTKAPAVGNIPATSTTNPPPVLVAPSKTSVISEVAIINHPVEATGSSTFPQQQSFVGVTSVIKIEGGVADPGLSPPNLKPSIESLNMGQGTDYNTPIRSNLKRHANANMEPTPRPKKSPNYSKVGPLYEKGGEGSLVLFEPTEADAFNLETNKNGIVPVVVNPELVNGLDPTNPKPLKEEQREGVQFMWDHFVEGKGCILAHEMGLGKTRTSITLLLTLLEQSQNSKGKSRRAVNKCIVLAPKNAVPVWEEEFTKWRPKTPEFVIKILTSSQKDGPDVVRDFETNANWKVLILSYDTFKKYSTYKTRDSFTFPEYKRGTVQLIFCDEAHVLRNEATQRAMKLQEFVDVVKPICIGLTGTPYQNTLLEYCSLVNFFAPGVLPPSYKQHYCQPIQGFFKKYGALTPELNCRLTELRDSILQVIHYRPNRMDKEKHEVVVCVALDGALDERPNALQHHIYRTLTDHHGMADRGLNFYQKLDILSKICVHPLLVKNELAKHKFTELVNEFDRRWPQEELDHMSKGGRQLLSSKIKLVIKMVYTILDTNSEEKIVIVALSNSTDMLSRIKDALQYPDCPTSPKTGASRIIGCVEYTGETTSDAKRKDKLNEFNNNPAYKVLLLSGKAGGTALTLTRANHMFLIDPDWNPANDRQILGRIYRHGQERNVFLYRFVCTGTIEEVKFINQLTKEELEKHMKSSDAYIKLPVVGGDDNELLKYCPPETSCYPKSQSRIRDMLDHLADGDESSEGGDEEVNSTANPVSSSGRNSMDTDDSDLGEVYENESKRQFAQTLSNAKQYKNADEVPGDILWPLKDGWADLVSYAFHISKNEQVDLLNLSLTESIRVVEELLAPTAEEMEVEEAPVAVDFTGRYEFVENINYLDYLVAIDVEDIKVFKAVKAQNQASFIQISHQTTDDEWCIKSCSFKTLEMKFKMDQEFEEEIIDGRKFMSTIRKGEGNKLMHVQKYESSVFENEWQFGDDKLTIVYKAGGKASGHYRKVDPIIHSAQPVD